MHVHLVSLHRISADTGAGGSILPREIVAAAEGAASRGILPPEGFLGSASFTKASGDKNQNPKNAEHLSY